MPSFLLCTPFAFPVMSSPRAFAQITLVFPQVSTHPQCLLMSLQCISHKSRRLGKTSTPCRQHPGPRAASLYLQVAETCQLAVARLEWLQQHPEEATCAGPYLSVDPAPPAAEQDVGRLREALLDEGLPLFERYRAMFALRNVGGKEAALALAEGEVGP